MSGYSRRSFLKKGSVVVAAAVAAPALPGLLATTSADAPEIEGEATAGAAPATAEVSGPVIAQLRDLASGEISIYTGTQEIVYRDPELANRLARAAGG
jgi:hypothetical protein